MWSSLLDIGYNWVSDSWKKSQVPLSELIMGSYLGRFMTQPCQEVRFKLFVLDSTNPELSESLLLSCDTN